MNMHKRIQGMMHGTATVTCLLPVFHTCMYGGGGGGNNVVYMYRSTPTCHTGWPSTSLGTGLWPVVNVDFSRIFIYYVFLSSYAV